MALKQCLEGSYLFPMDTLWRCIQYDSLSMLRHILKEFSLNNEGKLCYLRLVQSRHDGLIFTEV